MDISTCGWCYIQIEEQFGFIPCRFLQLQQEIQGIPLQYTMHFFPAEKNESFAADSDKRSEQLKSYSFTPSFFRADIGTKDRGSNPSSELKAKRKQSSISVTITCQECGTNSTLKWRSGPNGRKTLCNTCGLRWQKKQRALRDKEKWTNNEADKKTLTFVDSSIPNAPKEEASSLKYFLRSTTKENGKEKVKNSTSEKLQKIDDKDDSNKDPAPINKLSLSYILS